MENSKTFKVIKNIPIDKTAKQTHTKHSYLFQNNGIKQIETKEKVHLAVNDIWVLKQSSLKILRHLSVFWQDSLWFDDKNACFPDP